MSDTIDFRTMTSDQLVEHGQKGQKERNASAAEMFRRRENKFNRRNSA